MGIEVDYTDIEDDNRVYTRSHKRLIAFKDHCVVMDCEINQNHCVLSKTSECTSSYKNIRSAIYYLVRLNWVWGKTSQ